MCVCLCVCVCVCVCVCESVREGEIGRKREKVKERMKRGGVRKGEGGEMECEGREIGRRVK